MTITETTNSTLVPQLENVTDFCKTTDIKMHVLPAHENPYRSMQEQNLAFHYSCKLTNTEGNWFVVYFSKGLGLRTWVQPPEGFVITGSPAHVPHGQIGQRYDGPMPPWNDETPQADKDTFEHCSKPEAPFIEEVINCLANDCRGIEQSQGNFSAWCKTMRISDDSRTAKNAWDAVIKQRQQLAALLGEGEYHRLIYETEPETEPLK